MDQRKIYFRGDESDRVFVQVKKNAILSHFLCITDACIKHDIIKGLAIFTNIEKKTIFFFFIEQYIANLQKMLFELLRKDT